MLTPYLEGIRKEHIEKMEGEERKTLEKYVQKRDGEFIVDWRGLINDHENFLERASEGVEDSIYNSMLKYLEYKNVLSLGGKGIFFLLRTDNHLTGPRGSMFVYGFVNENDAREFRKQSREHANIVQRLD